MPSWQTTAGPLFATSVQVCTPRCIVHDHCLVTQPNLHKCCEQLVFDTLSNVVAKTVNIITPLRHKTLNNDLLGPSDYSLRGYSLGAYILSGHQICSWGCTHSPGRLQPGRLQGLGGYSPGGYRGWEATVWETTVSRATRLGTGDALTRLGGYSLGGYRVWEATIWEATISRATRF